MSAKRSQMWPGQRCGWQRLGAAQRGRAPGRLWGGRVPPAPAVRGQQRAALGLRAKLWGVGFWAWRWGCESLEAWSVGAGCRVGCDGGKRRGSGARPGRPPPATGANRAWARCLAGATRPSGGEAGAREATKAPQRWGGTPARVLRLGSGKFVPIARLRGLV